MNLIILNNSNQFVITLSDTTTITTNALNYPIENIKDINGNNRFIEGNVNTQSITGVTYPYAKWSLSGTHLLIVVSLITTNTIPANTKIAVVNNLPLWVVNKIIQINPPSSVVGYVKVVLRDFDSQTGITEITCDVLKNGNDLEIFILNELNTTSAGGRLQFDLLID